MLPRLIYRTLRSADSRCLRKFIWNFGVKGMLSVERFKRRLRRGEYFPPFLYLVHCQFLQPALPGVLGRRGLAQARDRTGHPQADDRGRQEAWQRVLRHPGRGAVHALEPVRNPGGAPGLLFSDLHQRPIHPPRKSPSVCGRWATPRPWSQSRAAPRPATSGRGNHQVFNRTLRGARRLPGSRAADRRGHQRVSIEHRRTAHRGVG